jgi:hypothetical protein
MPSAYLAGSDLAVYGVPNATAQQITNASALVDAYLGRPEGLQWMPDSNGLPCYMAGLTSPLTFTLPAAIQRGNMVEIDISSMGSLSVFGSVGNVLILDRSNPTAVEAVNIHSTTKTSITLFNVQNAHAQGATLEFGLVIQEQKTLPPKRSVTRVASWPIVRILSGLGSYRYGRRREQQAGLYADQSGLALMQTFGGPPEWIPWDPLGADFSVITNEVWVPSGIFLAYYSDVRIFYVAGFNQANIPPVIKQVTANIIAANLNTQNLAGGIKVARPVQGASVCLMSFLYPRIVSIRRQNTPAAASVGSQSFGGESPANETVIATNVPASIQYDRVGRVTPSNLPASSGLPYIKILIPQTALPLGTINKNDIVVDDIGQRYQVMSNIFTNFGYQLTTIFMAM